MSKRRFAVILFADIAGYTARMQQDESLAQGQLQAFREAMQKQVAAHQGEIVHFYGDGCLTLFNLPRDAAQAAIQLQQSFQAAAIPVRIGIHSGTVNVDEDHVFGDAINVASRVESMSVAGAVLLSKKVRDELKNQTQFQLQSLGSFAFKNVEEPMGVFALANEGLAIPGPEEMQGKGGKLKQQKKLTPSLIRMASVGLIVMAASAIIFWGVSLMATDQADVFSEEIKKERIAVIPFNNRTTDSNLDVFGDFCSDLITNGLTEAGIKASSPRTIQQYNHLIGVLPNNLEGKPSFYQVVGARYWVEGYFSQIGDTLTIKSHLTDGSNGDIVRNFPEIQGHISNKEGLVDELTRRLMSYWVARDVIDRGKFKPPTYEAFQEYQKIFTASESGWWTREHALKAFALDTTFYLAALEEMFWLADGRDAKYDSVLKLLAPHYEQMTTYEQIRFNAYKARYERDHPAYTKYNETLYQMFPHDLSQTIHYGFHLAWRENKPLKAWEVSNAIDWGNISEELHPFRKSLMYYIALQGLGAQKYQESIDLVDTYLPQEGQNFMIKSLIYARTKQLDSLYVLADKLSVSETLQRGFPFYGGTGMPHYNLVSFCNDVGQEFLLQDKPEEANKFLQIAINWTDEKPERLSTIFDSLELARTWRLLGVPEKSLPLEEAFVSIYIESGDSGFGWFAGDLYFSGIGIDYALLGQKEKAREIIRNFRGGVWPPYAKARVHAVLGEKEEAMLNCKEWLRIGAFSYFSAYLYKHDYFMHNMFGYPPFEEFVKVRD